MYARARDEKESAPFFSFFLPPRVLSLSCDSRFAAALVTATPYTARVRVPLPIILFFAVRQCYHSAAKLTGLHLFFLQISLSPSVSSFAAAFSAMSSTTARMTNPGVPLRVRRHAQGLAERGAR